MSCNNNFTENDDQIFTIKIIFQIFDVVLNLLNKNQFIFHNKNYRY